MKTGPRFTPMTDCIDQNDSLQFRFDIGQGWRTTKKVRSSCKWVMRVLEYEKVLVYKLTKIKDQNKYIEEKQGWRMDLLENNVEMLDWTKVTEGYTKVTLAKTKARYVYIMDL